MKRREKLKTAIIGLGHQATRDYIPSLQESQYARLEAICDIHERKLGEWQDKLGVRVYKDYRDMFDSERLDFVIAVTPHDVYRGIVEEVAGRRLHILKEKPLARDLEEAFYFKRLCDEAKVELMTAVQRRFNPMYSLFFQLAEWIGEPFYIDAKYTIFVDKPHDGWRGNRNRAGGGCIIDMGYHMIDIVIWYFGVPDEVHAEFSSRARPEEKYDAEDTASIMFSYKNGMHGSLVLSRYCPPKTEYIKIVGDRGMIQIETTCIRRLESNGEVAELYTRESKSVLETANQVDYFCRVIKGERQNIGNPTYHLNHMSFVDACYESKQSGRYISPRKLMQLHDDRRFGSLHPVIMPEIPTPRYPTGSQLVLPTLYE